MENINAFKAALSALLAALTALWGWFGWLVIAWIACMAIDYITGSCAAIRAGKWSSSVARDGIWHKMGCAVAVIVAAILDMVIGMILADANIFALFDREVLAYSLLRLIVMPVALYAVCLLLKVPALVTGVCVILTGMPAGATTSILAPSTTPTRFSPPGSWWPPRFFPW